MRRRGAMAAPTCELSLHSILTASCVRGNAGILLRTRRVVNKDGCLTAYQFWGAVSTFFY